MTPDLPPHTPTKPPVAPLAAPSAPHLWGIEGLRGLAACMVVWCHYRHGLTDVRALDGFTYTGVDLFFVLSGFVFAPYLFGKPLGFWDFLLRRVMRIFPLYLTALLLYVGLRAAQGVALPWQYFWQHAAMLHTTQSTAIAGFYNLAFWSLPPELEFYALLPLLALVSRRVPGAARWFLAGLLAVALVVHGVLAYATVSLPPGSPWLLANVHLPGLLGEFLLGCVAWRLSSTAFVRAWGVWLLLPAVGIWLAIAHTWVTLGDAGIGAHPVLRGNVGYVAALAYMLLVTVVGRYSLANNTGEASGMALRLPVWLQDSFVRLCLLGGQLSYGLYLLHNAGQELSVLLWPALTGWPRLLAALALTAGATWFLHHLVEAPARRWSRRWRVGQGPR